MPKKHLNGPKAKRRLKKAPVKVNADAKPSIKRAISAKPNDRHGFLLPRGLAGDFNAAGKMVEVRAIPNYVRNDLKPEELAEFRFVLAGLAQRGNRDAIFLTEFELYVPPAETESERRAFDIIEGKSAVGINLALLSARTERNQHALLFVVEDKLREKMVVAGPEKIPTYLRTELARNGVSYVVRDSAECSSVVNDFVSDGALYRSRQKLLLAGHEDFIDQELVKSVATLCAMRDEKLPGRGYTLGQAIHLSAGDPNCHMQILRSD